MIEKFACRLIPPTSWFFSFVIAISLAVVGSRSTLGQEAEKIDLKTLPKSPPNVERWLKDWEVQFTTGKLPPDHAANRRRLSGFTQYEVAYTYKCQPTWRFDRTSGNIRIQVRFTQVSWQPKHTIWLRYPPEPNSFWDDKLVLHELDHVQLSGDTRMKKLFIEKLRAKRTITQSVRGRGPVNQSMVDRIVKEHVASVFEEVSEMIDIRYKELDRVTSHGRLSIPKDSEVEGWLKR
ncbi:MAG: hypothetical protein AAGI63_14585 [Planctomycetota bacterium]